jgi:hypothetical protein
MSTQTVLNIILSVLTLGLGISNYMLATKKENQRESAEMTEIRVQYNQVMGMLHDLQKDMKNVSILSERVVVIETRLTEIYARLEKLEDHGNK